MIRDRKSRTSMVIGGTLLLIAAVSFTTLKSSAHSAATMPQLANSQSPNLRVGQSAQRRLPVTASPNNDQQKALVESQSDALKRLNQLADDASLIGDSSARSRLLARIASLLWPHDETRARMLFKFAFDRAIDIPKPDDVAKEKRLTCGLVRAEVTRLFAEHDPKSAAEQLLNSANETTCYYGPRNRASSEHPRSELLSLTALSLASNDPDLAY